jgi:glycolate oxidase FAD binding subunit
LREVLGPLGSGVEELHSSRSAALWAEIRDVTFFPADKQVWRISVAPSEGEAVARMCGGEYVLDWAGGLVWAALEPAPDAHAERVRGAFKSGHATLMRADDGVRAQIPVFHPQTGALAALLVRVRESYDPSGIFNPGRMA